MAEPPAPQLPPLPDSQDLKGEVRALRARATALSNLSKAVESESPTRIQRAVERLEKQDAPAWAALVERTRAWLEAEQRHRGRLLWSELGRACAEREMELLLLTRQPLELRIPPVSIAVDLERNQAAIGFAEQVLERTEARAAPLLEARARAVRTLEGRSWDPERFLAQLFEVWQALRTGASDWVSLAEVLPRLTWLRQPARFRRDPTARNYQPYSRARFAYDLWRLRRDRQMEREGWRLSLGPATGGSTRHKHRVFFLEDDRGRGQYHLTLRFVPPPETEGADA